MCPFLKSSVKIFADSRLLFLCDCLSRIFDLQRSDLNTVVNQGSTVFENLKIKYLVSVNKCFTFDFY